MAPQTQMPTNEGYGELGKLAAGEGATPVDCVGGLKTTCPTDETATHTGVTWSSESGLVEVAADSVKSSKTTVTADTVELDHVFTAGAAATVVGFGTSNTDKDVLFGWCCFNAAVVMETSDTLTVEMKMQFKKGS